MKKFISVVLLFSILIFNSSLSFAIDEEDNCPFQQTIDCSEYTGVNAAVRSLFMPGWGQGWNEQYTKGWITFGIFAISTFGYFYFNNKAQDYHKKYDDGGSVDKGLYDDYSSSRTNANVCGIVALTTWVFAIVDAYFVANAKSKHYAFGEKFNLVAYGEDGAIAKYNIKF